jgi:glycerol uptake operon antiterminator
MKTDVRERFFQSLRTCRMIASITEPKHMELALKHRSRLSGVFLLTGHIGVVQAYVELFKAHRVPVFLHLDKIGGLSTDIHGMQYIAKVIQPTGIITTKTNVAQTAKRLGLITIQRFFLVDSEGLDNIANSLGRTEPDLIEIMPARMPEILGMVRRLTSIPIITGGLLFEPEQAAACLKNGAAAVSSSKPELWKGLQAPAFI